MTLSGSKEHHHGAATSPRSPRKLSPRRGASPEGHAKAASAKAARPKRELSPSSKARQEEQKNAKKMLVEAKHVKTACEKMQQAVAKLEETAPRHDAEKAPAKRPTSGKRSKAAKVEGHAVEKKHDGSPRTRSPGVSSRRRMAASPLA